MSAATLAIVPLPARPLGPRMPVDPLEAWLAGRSPRTLRAYASDLSDFARFTGAESPSAAVGLLLALSQGDANAAALAYRASMIERGLSAATVARRLGALRSLVKLARTIGRVSWALDVESPHVERLRDVAGPGAAGWRAMLATLEMSPDSALTRRDRAIVRLLHDRGLRRLEVISLDVADVDLSPESPGVTVIGKGRTARERLTVNEPTRLALVAWLEARGSEPGPLFVRLDRAAITPDRLTGEAVRQLVARLGRRAGLGVVRPHGLRHAAITQALDATAGDVRSVAVFSRHRDVQTVMIYDDRRRDVGGEITRLLA